MLGETLRVYKFVCFSQYLLTLSLVLAFLLKSRLT